MGTTPVDLGQLTPQDEDPHCSVRVGGSCPQRSPEQANQASGVGGDRRPRAGRRRPGCQEWQLVSNYSQWLWDGEINYGFTCDDKPFGYYADIANHCQIFHICYPEVNADGVEEMRWWSFLCGPGTQFDQGNLVCNYPNGNRTHGYCSRSDRIYDVNDYFHRESVEFIPGGYDSEEQERLRLEAERRAIGLEVEEA